MALFKSSKRAMCDTYQSSRAFISETAKRRSLSSSSAMLKTLPKRSFSRVNFSSIFCNSGSRKSTCLLDFAARSSNSRIRLSFSVSKPSRPSFSISRSTISFSKTSISALRLTISFSWTSYASYSFSKRSCSSPRRSSVSLS